jgi:hypothetical protein
MMKHGRSIFRENIHADRERVNENEHAAFTAMEAAGARHRWRFSSGSREGRGHCVPLKSWGSSTSSPVKRGGQEVCGEVVRSRRPRSSIPALCTCSFFSWSWDVKAPQGSYEAGRHNEERQDHVLRKAGHGGQRGEDRCASAARQRAGRTPAYSITPSAFLQI